MHQTAFVCLLIAAAAAFLLRRLWRTLVAPASTGCAKGCGGACGAGLDVDALQRTIEARQKAR